MKIISILLIFIFTRPLLFAQKILRNEAGFNSDNDAYLFIGLDKYYTNGIFVHYRHALKENKPGIKKIWELNGGQRMYNPFAASIFIEEEIDRPFAAYLFAASKFEWLKKDKEALSAELQVGCIGPQAKGEQLQKWIHATFHFYPVRGWEFQINDETEVNASFKYLKQLWENKNKQDIYIQSALHAGTTFSGAEAGLAYRLGTINGLNHSVFTHSRIGESKSLKKECFFYGRSLFHYIAYDASIQGGIFLENKGRVTFQVQPFVFSQEAGFAYATGHWQYQYAITYTTKEVKSTAAAHAYGTLAISYLF